MRWAWTSGVGALLAAFAWGSQLPAGWAQPPEGAEEGASGAEVEAPRERADQPARPSSPSTEAESAEPEPEAEPGASTEPEPEADRPADVQEEPATEPEAAREARAGPESEPEDAPPAAAVGRPRPDLAGLQGLRGSVVAVASAGSRAAGVVVHSNRYVVTSAWAVRRGRDVDVLTMDGTHIEADAVRLSRDLGLAVVRLSKPVSAPPLVAARQLPPAGTEVAVVQARLAGGGHPSRRHHRHRGVSWLVHRGEIAGSDEGDLLVASAVEVRPGAAVVGPGGQLLAVVRGSDGGILRATPATRLDEIVEGVEQADEYRGRVRPFVRLGWTFQKHFDDDFTVHGPTISAGLMLFDKGLVDLLYTPALLNFEERELNESVDASAHLVELYLGYRILMTPSTWNRLYFTPAIGGVLEVLDFRLDVLRVRGMSTFTDVRSEFDNEVTVMPALRLALTGGFFEIAVSGRVDVQSPAKTRMGLSLAFGM